MLLLKGGLSGINSERGDGYTLYGRLTEEGGVDNEQWGVARRERNEKKRDDNVRESEEFLTDERRSSIVGNVNNNNYNKFHQARKYMNDLSIYLPPPPSQY